MNRKVFCVHCGYEIEYSPDSEASRASAVQDMITHELACHDNPAAAVIATKNARIAELEAQLEIERMRLAACSVAALGYYDECSDEYKSASLADVLNMRSLLTRCKADLSTANSRIAELEALVAMATRYTVGDTQAFFLTVEKRGEGWAVRLGTYVLNRSGSFEYEPMPSNRSAEFVERTRYTREEALRIADERTAKHDRRG